MDELYTIALGNEYTLTVGALGEAATAVTLLPDSAAVEIRQRYGYMILGTDGPILVGEDLYSPVDAGVNLRDAARAIAKWLEKTARELKEQTMGGVTMQVLPETGLVDGEREWLAEHVDELTLLVTELEMSA